MKKLWRKIFRGEKGFTLVELMIVIIILAVLTGIAVPSYMALRNRARESATESEMKNIATALELYQADNEKYPADYTTMTGYMDPIPTADDWSTAYTYTCADPYATYTLTSDGADATNGTADDITIADGVFTATGAY